MIALLAAVAEETDLIRETLEDSAPETVNGMLMLTGRIHGQDVCLAHGGIGKAAAAAATISLLQACQPEALVLFGCGGAYPNSGLNIGDLALADTEIFGDRKFNPKRLFKLARSKAYLFAGVEIRWKTDIDDGETPPEQRKVLSFVLDRGMELMASAGYATEWNLERFWRDVKTVEALLLPVQARVHMARHYFGPGIIWSAHARLEVEPRQDQTSRKRCKINPLSQHG